jgi:hypothetical protein
MIRALTLALCLAAPASAATVAQWDESATGGTGYVFDITDNRAAFYNDVTWWTPETADRTFTGTILGFSYTATFHITTNLPGFVNDAWTFEVHDLAEGWTLDFGTETGGTGSVPENSWDYAILRPPPAPVPLPAAGIALATAIIALRRLRK